MNAVAPFTSARNIDDLPGPRGLPWLGNLAAFKLDRIHQTVEAWAEQYGPLFRFRLGPKPVVVVADAATSMRILRERPQKFRRISSIEPVFEEMGLNGVFSREGEAWQRQRRITMQAFQPQYLRAFHPTLLDIGTRLRRRWEKLAEAETDFDVTAELTRYTVDVVTAFALGHDLRTLEGNADIIQEHLEKLFPAVNRRVSALFPYWRYLQLPADRSLTRSLPELHSAVLEFIARARTSLAAAGEGGRQPRNFLEALLLARDEDGSAFSDKDITANALTMLLAGEDTTAHSIGWILYYLSEQPDVQQRLQEEVDSKLGSAADLAEMSLLDDLPYLDAVAQETMRLKPVAPLLFLETITDVTVKDVAIPAGTAIFLAMRPPGLDAAHFPDPHSFKPERWLNFASAEAEAQQRRQMQPFGGGARFCPGRMLALLEIKHALFVIARHFKLLRAHPERPVREVFSFAMMPGDLRIRLTARRKA